MKKKEIIKAIVQLALVVGALVAAFVVARILKETAPEPKQKPDEIFIPVVEVMEVSKKNVRVGIHSQGTVVPRTETDLVAEIPGKVVEISPALDQGGIFEKGDVLLVIDPRDYEMALVQAEADLAAAEAGLEQEKAQAKQAKEDWERMGEGEQPPLSARTPQLKEAQARLRSAWAMLQNAETNLERTRIVAPYSGRTREKFADIGQYLTSGSQVARVFATDYVEVSLPLRNQQLALVDLPFQVEKGGDVGNQPFVTLSAEFGNRVHEWKGKVVRTEAAINIQDRLLYAIARVDDPYDRKSNYKAPLPVGLFVEAEIEGVELKDVAVLPRLVLRENNTLHIVDKEDSSLDVRKVDVIHADQFSVYIGKEVEVGELVSLSPLETPVPGMKLNTQESETSTTSEDEMKVAQKPKEE